MNFSNASYIDIFIADLQQVIGNRIAKHISQESFDVSVFMNDLFANDRIISGFGIKLQQQISANECIVLLLALVPHIQPNLFESIIAEHLPAGGDFPEFGGVRVNNQRSLLPTGETAQFILAGNNLEDRLNVYQYFTEEHFFFKNSILWLEPVKEGEPQMSGRIIIAQEWVDKLLLGKETAPRFGLDFPAKRITTAMLWEDAVLHPKTIHQVNDIKIWLHHHHLLYKDENLQRKVKPGYRVLFYGPSGTGKTLTATLLGNQFEKDVYRIDLSQIVSKYIGETEKNLESVFKKAESKNWILFFDEADALFGKRTNVQSSHDKYANQEVSYLLQRVEDYPGLLILASNLKNNLDESFIRRFNTIVYFPMPNANDRLKLWQKSLPERLVIDESVNLNELAAKYELSGAAILNAVQYATLQCYSAKTDTMLGNHIMEGIRKEFMKEERTI